MPSCLLDNHQKAVKVLNVGAEDLELLRTHKRTLESR